MHEYELYPTSDKSKARLEKEARKFEKEQKRLAKELGDTYEKTTHEVVKPKFKLFGWN